MIQTKVHRIVSAESKAERCIRNGPKHLTQQASKQAYAVGTATADVEKTDPFFFIARAKTRGQWYNRTLSSHFSGANCDPADAAAVGRSRPLTRSLRAVGTRHCAVHTVTTL